MANGNIAHENEQELLMEHSDEQTASDNARHQSISQTTLLAQPVSSKVLVERQNSNASSNPDEIQLARSAAIDKAQNQ